MPPETQEAQTADVGQTTQTTQTQEPTAEQKRIAQLEQEKEQLRTEREQARGYAYALTQRLAQTEQARPEVDANPEERQQRVKQALDDDPEGTLDAHFRERVAPLMANQYRTLANMNKDAFVRSIDPKQWQKYAPEVEEFVKGFSPETMAEKDAWANAFNFVRMNHLDDIVEERLRERAEEQNRKNLLESGATGAASSTAPTRQISNAEKDAMAYFGMDEKEWRKYGATNLTQEQAGQE